MLILILHKVVWSCSSEQYFADTSGITIFVLTFVIYSTWIECNLWCPYDAKYDRSSFSFLRAFRCIVCRSILYWTLYGKLLRATVFYNNYSSHSLMMLIRKSVQGHATLFTWSGQKPTGIIKQWRSQICQAVGSSWVW